MEGRLRGGPNWKVSLKFIKKVISDTIFDIGEKNFFSKIFVTLTLWVAHSGGPVGVSIGGLGVKKFRKNFGPKFDQNYARNDFFDEFRWNFSIGDPP